MRSAGSWSNTSSRFPRSRAGSRPSAAHPTLSPAPARGRGTEKPDAMSDHVDGPRQIGDPSADLTDLFAFISPADPNRTVLAANVFPSAGTQAMFSNAVNHAIVARRLSIAGTGDQ